MVSQTNEAALESHIESALAKDGYRIGEPADFDQEFAVDSKLFGISSKPPSPRSWQSCKTGLTGSGWCWSG